MKIEIKSIWGDLLFEGDFSSLAEAVTAAVKSGASLVGASLVGASLDGARLDGASLVGARLDGASLVGARLDGASLVGASLVGASLDGASLVGASLVGAKMSDAAAKNLYAVRTILPGGDLIGYKKLSGGVIAKLLIPSDAKRVGGMVGRKCRAEFAKVLEGSGFSTHDSSFEYRTGEIVRPKEKFDTSLLDECRSGIHFFITRAEAEAY